MRDILDETIGRVCSATEVGDREKGILQVPLGAIEARFGTGGPDMGSFEATVVL
jgi:hypothetical protein